MTGADPRRDARVRVRSTDVPAASPDPRPGPGEGAVPGGGAPSARRRPRAGRRRDRLARGCGQLRLGLACVASFLAVVTLLTVTMSGVPALDDVVLLGVPLPWLVHAYGFYPVIVAFAVVFAVAAARNSARTAVAEGTGAPDEPGPDDGGAP